MAGENVKSVDVAVGFVTIDDVPSRLPGCPAGPLLSYSASCTWPVPAVWMLTVAFVIGPARVGANAIGKYRMLGDVPLVPDALGLERTIDGANGANCFCAVSAIGGRQMARTSPTQVFGAAPLPEKH